MAASRHSPNYLFFNLNCGKKMSQEWLEFLLFLFIKQERNSVIEEFKSLNSYPKKSTIKTLFYVYLILLIFILVFV